MVQLALLGLVAAAFASPILQKRAFPASEQDFNELRRASILAKAAYYACSPTAGDVTVTLQIDNAETDTQGYIGYSDSQQTIAVVMRGSTTAKDFENDQNTNLVTPSLSGVAFPADVRIIQGVYDPWASVHDQVIAEVQRLIEIYPSYTLESAGHSLGGSLTYMSYIALAQNFPNKNITSNALAAFQIGNEAFANFGEEQHGLIRRGNNQDDGIPNSYPELFHYGIEFYGNGTLESTVQCEGQRDPQCSAGNGQTTLTPGHLSSFGIAILVPSCSS